MIDRKAPKWFRHHVLNRKKCEVEYRKLISYLYFDISTADIAFLYILHFYTVFIHFIYYRYDGGGYYFYIIVIAIVIFVCVMMMAMTMKMTVMRCRMYLHWFHSTVCKWWFVNWLLGWLIGFARVSDFCRRVPLMCLGILVTAGDASWLCFPPATASPGWSGGAASTSCRLVRVVDSAKATSSKRSDCWRERLVEVFDR